MDVDTCSTISGESLTVVSEAKSCFCKEEEEEVEEVDEDLLSDAESPPTILPILRLRRTVQLCSAGATGPELTAEEFDFS